MHPAEVYNRHNKLAVIIFTSFGPADHELAVAVSQGSFCIWQCVDSGTKVMDAAMDVAIFVHSMHWLSSISY